MATSVTSLAMTLQEETEWQRTPEILSAAQYEGMIVQAIKRLLIDTGRALKYDAAMLKEEEHVDGENVTKETFIDLDFAIDEEMYILICAKINFFKKVQSDVNNIVGYTTDALTVTNADKPYTHLQDTINSLENERRITYYKMIRFCL